METFQIKAIGHIIHGREEIEDDYWGGQRSSLLLGDAISAESLLGLDAFSHVEILFIFDRVKEENITLDARHPRNNKDWPKVGIFAQRAKGRPNRIGSTICRVIEIKDKELVLEGLDAIEGTPIIDIKPVMTEFLPKETIKQAAWSKELMLNYWK